MIAEALREYQSNVTITFDVSVAREFANYMLGEIKKNE